MSKSIYEEAIGQLLKIQGRLSTNYDKFLEVKQALEQAQKQEKLLSLYKELSNYVCEQCYAHKLPEITRLKILIEELENDK
jgi:hypothetical protein